MHLLLAILPASGQDLDTFTPSGAWLSGQPALQLHHPALAPDGQASIGFATSFADDPLIEIYDDGTISPIISGMVASWLAGSITLPQVRLSAAVPLYPAVVLAEETVRATGDAIFLLTLPRSEHVALIPEVRLPLGPWGRYTSAGGQSAGLTAAFAEQTEWGGLTANLGAVHAPTVKVRATTLGSHLRGGLGGYWQRSRLRIGAELTGTLDLPAPTWSRAPIELHGYTTLETDDGAQATLALGTGLVGGLGAPDYRAMLGISRRWQR